MYKDIPGYEGLYQASESGDIRVMARKVRCRGGAFAIRRSKLLSQHPSDRPYLHVVLTGKDKKRSTKRVHLLIALTFLGEKPKRLVVDHLDGNVTNNNIDNLEYVTSRENTLRGFESKRGKLRGAHYHKSMKKWQSEISINGKRKYLGTFKTEQKAHEAYMQELKNLGA